MQWCDAAMLQGCYGPMVRWLEPKKRKPSALYQNPGTIRRFEKSEMSSLEFECISVMSSPKGENRTLSRKSTALDQNPDIFPIMFNNFIQLMGHLGATLGPVFKEIMEDKGRKVKNGPQKWHVDVEWHL